MCGIAGILDFQGAPVEISKALEMARVQAHRGPDGNGAVFFSANGSHKRFSTLDDPGTADCATNTTVALVHQRLSILDLSPCGAQPMADSSHNYWITYNGEIYNYIELRNILKNKGYTFQSTSDTEVILYAYIEWGVACLDHFNGMFAFAIWDVKQCRLFCARDRLGIKPFYYYFKNNRFIFASEEKAILAAVDYPLSPNVASMADYLTFSYVPSDETMFQGIRRLDPGSYLLATSNGLNLHTYWNPVFESEPGTEIEWIDELRELLDDSVRIQLRSDVPVGAHLSGGIDSSAVCCLAARHVPKLITFTASFNEGGFFDESPYASLVSKHINSDYRLIQPSRTDLIEVLPKIIYHLDEPVEGASVFGKYCVAELVSQHVKVVLGGQGGDELFGGYDWYIKNLFTAACFGANVTVPGGSRPRFIWNSLTQETTKRLAKSLWKNFGETRLDRIFCNNWSRFQSPAREKVFRTEVLGDLRLTPEERFLASFERLPEPRHLDRMFKFDARYYLQALLTSEDRLSMAFSVESRVPLLDHRIVELAGRVGSDIKTRPGKSKELLRRALRDVVPAAILDRRDKRGFPTPIGQWLSDPQLNLMETLVLNDNKFARQYFDLQYVKKLSKSSTYGSTDASERLWRILNLSVWGEVFGLG